MIYQLHWVYSSFVEHNPHLFLDYNTCPSMTISALFRKASSSIPISQTIIAFIKMFSFSQARGALSFALLFGLYISLVASQNFKAHYGNSPAPFKIDVNPTFIKETVLKASLTRYVVDVEEPDLIDGPPRHNVTTVRDYWVNQYNWFDVQDRLNQR